jgi:hypothetical protein
VKWPRDLDIRSGAFVLFGFVVIVTFGGLASIAVACRIFRTSCIADSPPALESIRSLVENVIAVLLALMAGGTTRGPPKPPDLPG